MSGDIQREYMFMLMLMLFMHMLHAYAEHMLMLNKMLLRYGPNRTLNMDSPYDRG